MAVQKTTVHAASATVHLAAPSSVTQNVTINPVTLNERMWVSTNPLVSIYPWLGSALMVGITSSFSVLPGQILYAYSNQPAQLSVTIA